MVTRDSPVHHVDFDDGLTNTEVLSTEAAFGLRFPEDLRALLQTGLPRGPGFPDWRAGDRTALRFWLDEPSQGVLFDVEHAAFWLPEWGARPLALTDALTVAREALQAAPRLIPIFAHRMIPEEPHSSGDPVLSVYQTDIIYYGFDLVDYLQHEFRVGPRRPWPVNVRAIRFWDSLVS
ncbi:MAG: hypothetical protein HOW73_18875 [Polyangiaceae bacterium]|nr:hypothetical protein [Polyangiaceae bacterium]